MVDKTFTDGASPLFFPAGVVNGLFRWTEGATAAVKGALVKLAGADGPPIDVDLVDGANNQNIGVVFEGGQKLNDIISILTKYTGIISMTVGTGGVTRGDDVKSDASGDIIIAATADVGTAATGATVTRVVGTALQSGAAADIVYVGLHA